MAKKPQLLGLDGEPIDRSLLNKEIAAPQLSSVRSIDSSHPSIGLTPEKLAAVLRSAENGDATAYLELAEDMEEKDLHYRSVLTTRKLQVSQLPVKINAASDEPRDVEIADFVRDWLLNDELELALFDMLDAIAKGYSPIELIWSTGEKWLPTLKHRDPRWFEFDRVDGETLRLLELGMPQPLPAYKFAVHRHKTKTGLPIRGGLARAIAWGWMFKNYTIKDWMAFAEIYGMPIRVGKYPANATDEERRTLLRAVAAIGADAAAIIPQGMALEFVESVRGVSGGNVVFKELAEYLDQQVSKAVLGQTATTDAISGGHAVGKTHDGVRADVERADAKQLAATITRQIVRPVVDLNFGPQEKYPTCQIGREDQVDLKTVIEGVKALVPLGMDVSVSQVRDLLGLDEPDEGEPLLRASKVAAPAAPGAGDDPKEPADPDDPADPQDPDAKDPDADPPPHKVAAAEQGAGDDDAIDESVAWMLEHEGWAPQIEGLQEALARATTVEEASALLAEHFAAIGTDQLADLLARATFNARLAGETGTT